MTRGHVITEIKSPVCVIVRCSCGWSHTESRRQNARARCVKLASAKKAHLKTALAAERDHHQIVAGV